MGAITQWIAAILVMLAIGGVATFYFMGIQQRRDESAAGIVALSGVSWRSFIGMVLQALHRRGYTQVVDREDVSGDRDYVLEREGGRWLLSCKHGATFVLGRNAVQALAGDVNLKGAAGGLLVTQGQIDAEAREIAAQRRVELLDGKTLWPELRDLMPPEQLAGIRAHASDRARQRSLLGWLFALLAGIATFMLMPAPVETARDAAPGAPTSPGTAEPAPVIIAPPPRLPIEQQRQDLASAVSTLPQVDRAIWATASTLQVFVPRTDDEAIFADICALVLRQPDLTASRIQLTPPADSGMQTRFRQCRSF
ncbi:MULTISPECIES: restriction endonuclease [Luteimonas]|uniref:restriction endonuclease n=1 Tax=Luteimonas TaxID=83614 RepID=UPI000C7DB937|nr:MULTISPECIES: restriction endonuclease [Luteimonas]